MKVKVTKEQLEQLEARGINKQMLKDGVKNGVYPGAIVGYAVWLESETLDEFLAVKSQVTKEDSDNNGQEIIPAVPGTELILKAEDEAARIKAEAEQIKVKAEQEARVILEKAAQKLANAERQEQAAIQHEKEVAKYDAFVSSRAARLDADLAEYEERVKREISHGIDRHCAMCRHTYKASAKWRKKNPNTIYIQ